MMCNDSAANGAEIRVDHIKPVSIYPELALVESNLQVLCRMCNLGKSNRYQHDFRSLQKIPVRAVIKRVKLTKEQRWIKAHSRLANYIKKLLAEAESGGGLIETARLMKAYLRVQKSAKDIPSHHAEELA